MGYIAIDKDGQEWFYDEKPVYAIDEWHPAIIDRIVTNCYYMETGSIKELIGEEIKWPDKPVSV